ncbi:hypothetical protein AG1IA_02866 [Rhizoctonia solani AG-1 IA]|uniref:Uncharacterized protein n=1 Tax=Thanatephorus cucumeris (strain AG1-IA) TaxID=983506 RepID=L8WYN2_THACA|nr:hypothetical protein AG1IA_02866 [Rhizoctonia solani AG-1 IA]
MSCYAAQMSPSFPGVAWCPPNTDPKVERCDTTALEHIHRPTCSVKRYERQEDPWTDRRLRRGIIRHWWVSWLIQYIHIEPEGLSNDCAEITVDLSAY